jgi:transcription elongation factor Elf1
MSPRIIDVLMYIGQNYMNKNMGRGDMKYSQWNKLKSKKLKDCGYTCSKCGLQNSKLNFERVSEDYIISCRACNIIMNCKLSNLNEIVLCYSKKTQEYIVKKTID